MRLPQIIEHVQREVDLYGTGQRCSLYHVPSKNAVIVHYRIPPLYQDGRQYGIYRATPVVLTPEGRTYGVPMGLVRTADTLAQALQQLGWTPLRAARQTPKKPSAHPPPSPPGLLWPRPKRKRKPLTPEQRAAATARRRQQRAAWRDGVESRVDAIMTECAALVAANPSLRPLRRWEVERYQKLIQKPRGPVYGAAALIQIFQRVARDQERRDEQRQAQEEAEAQAREERRQQRQAEKQQAREAAAAQKRAQVAAPVPGRGSPSVPGLSVPAVPALPSRPAPEEEAESSPNPALPHEVPPPPIARIYSAPHPWGSPRPRVSRLIGPSALTAEEQRAGRIPPWRSW